jgi:hypothetical protein
MLVRKLVSRVKFRRIYALRRLVDARYSATAYFSNLDDTLNEHQIARKAFRDIEVQLRGLDATAWRFLKHEVMPYLAIRDPKRGWTQLFNLLNQANAYNYLARIGCKDISFIPRSSVPGRRTPDLKARLQSEKVLCEVKTINISEDEASVRANYLVRNIALKLDGNFFTKLQTDCEQASQQMGAYCADADVKRIVYIIINFDDLLHEYIDSYFKQIEKYIVDHPFPNLEVVFDVKPAYYYATP